MLLHCTLSRKKYICYSLEYLSMKNKEMHNKKSFNSELAKRFRDLRNDKDLTDKLQLTKITDNKPLTQEKLAELLGVGRKLIQDIENCRRGISKRTAKIMADIFRYSNVDYLLDENVEHKSELDKLRTRWQRIKKNDALKLQIVSSLAELNGYSVEINEPKNNRKITIDEPMTDEEVDEVIPLLKNYYLFKKDNKIEFSLSLPDIYNLGDNMAEMFMSSIKWYLNIKQEYGK